MATPKQIETALGQHLAATTGIPAIVWPNQGGDPARPFVFCQHVPVSRTDATTEGSGEVATGYLTATVVIKAGTFTDDALDIAEAIRQQFLFGATIAAGSGKITVTKPTEVLPGFRDGPDWRVPVRVDYREEG